MLSTSPLFTLLLLFLFLDTVSLQRNKASTEKPIPNHIISSISKWWKQNSDQNPTKCSQNTIPLSKSKMIHYIPRATIQSYTCVDGTSPSQYLFLGLNKTNYPEGKGRLRKISDSEWKTWSITEKDKFISRKVCYHLIESNGVEIKEIIGTFKDGLLHGSTKIKWEDNSTTIAKFSKGYVHGFQRHWNGKGKLTHAGLLSKGLETGFHWRVMLDHLVYTDESIINNEGKRLTLLFPLLKNGSYGNPLSGNLNPHIDTLENVRQVKLISIKSRESDCILKIEYEKTKKQNYRYMLRHKARFPLSMHQSSPFCNRNRSEVLEGPNRRLRNFFKYTDQLIYGTKPQSFHEGYQIMWYLKPLLEVVNKAKSLKLISNVTFHHINKTSTAVILGSKPLRIKFLHIGVNKHEELDGYCDISVIPEDWLLVPRDNSLQWPPNRIKGMFIRGELNGIAIIGTNTVSSGWVTVKDGVLHGPVIFHGLHPVLPVKLETKFLGFNPAIIYPA